MLAPTLEPKVTACQELIVPRRPPTLSTMDEKLEFAQRLNKLCDDKGVPPKGQNRQKTLGDLFGVSQKGARKWLEAESMPKRTQLIAIAKWAGVYVEWLESGRGPQYLADAMTPAMRPKVRQLMRVAETLSDYSIDHLIKIGPALDEPSGSNGGSRDNGETPPTKKRTRVR